MIKKEKEKTTTLSNNIWTFCREKARSMLLIDSKEICLTQICLDIYTSPFKMAITLILIKIINCLPKRKAQTEKKDICDVQLKRSKFRSRTLGMLGDL